MSDQSETAAIPADYVRPLTKTENMLAEIWRDLFNVAHVDVHDNFFDFGGDSLYAARIVSRVRSLWSIDLTIEMLMDHPTLELLAQLVDRTVSVIQQRQCDPSLQPSDESR